MIYDNYSFPIFDLSSQDKKLLIKFYLVEPSKDNEYSLFNNRILLNFRFMIMSWFYVAIVDGFDLGKIEIPKSDLNIRKSIENYIKIDENNWQVSFEIDLSNSSTELLRTLFRVLNNKYYHSWKFDHEKNIEISKVEIADGMEGNDDPIT